MVLIDYLARRVIEDAQSVNSWEQELRGELCAMRERTGRERFSLVVCLDNLSIRPGASEAYRTMAARVIAEFADSYARYGCQATVRTLIATTALGAKWQANLFDSQTDAIAHVLAIAPAA